MNHTIVNDFTETYSIDVAYDTPSGAECPTDSFQLWTYNTSSSTGALESYFESSEFYMNRQIEHVRCILETQYSVREPVCRPTMVNYYGSTCGPGEILVLTKICIFSIILIFFVFKKNTD